MVADRWVTAMGEPVDGASFVAWAVASRPMRGQEVCGDVATVQIN
jgi:hypothetical protein